MSIEEVTRELVKDMEQNEALKPEGDPRPITVAGIEGRSVTLHSVSPFSSANGQPQRERDWLVTVPQRDGSVIFMIFVAPHSEFDRFQPTYEAMLKSVQFSAQRRVVITQKKIHEDAWVSGTRAVPRQNSIQTPKWLTQRYL